MKMTTQEFIDKSIQKHETKYDYSLVEYLGSNKKVKIICPDHGVFEQLATQHIQGRGCPECGRKQANKSNTLTQKEFIERSTIKHNGKYDYSKVKYVNAKTKVIIICPDHGEFEQRANIHLFGQGCPECSYDNQREKFSYNIDDWKEKSSIKHNGKYDYSLITEQFYSKSFVKIICPDHGVFEQRADQHLFGSGCPECGIEKRANILSLTLEEFIEKGTIKHNGKYDYSLVDYKGGMQKVKIICPDHGVFEQRANQHLFGSGCPECAINNGKSKAEEEIYNYLKEYNINNIQKHDKNILSNQRELDLYLSDYKIAIEYNGLYWHSEDFCEKNYHQEKYKECLNNGIRLIQIFEDEWIYKESIVLSRLRNILNIKQNKIYARKCKILKLENKDVRDFLNDNHIQGYCNAQVIYGLFYDTGLGEELVSLMSFSKPRINLGRKQTKDNVYELLRFVSLKDYSVIGGASKILKHFIKEHKPEEIYSYCDLRWSQGNLYTSLGFEEISINKPNYFYVDNQERLNRFNFRKDILIKDYGCPQEMTEKEFMKNVLKKKRIYDAGTKLFRLKIKNI